MTANTPNAQAEMLCTLAANDLSVLRFELPDDIYGFHAQQSCEKLLKALISAHGKTYPHTHKLAKLIAQVTEYGEILPEVPYPILGLEPYSVEFRYETGEPLSSHDRKAILLSVQKLQGHILARISTLQLTQPTFP